MDVVYLTIRKVLPVRKLLFILSLALVLASCSKEELVPPGDRTTDVTLGGAFSKEATGDETTDPDSGTISDDGDDLNDGEGRRKKKKP